MISAREHTRASPVQDRRATRLNALPLIRARARSPLPFRRATETARAGTRCCLPTSSKEGAPRRQKTQNVVGNIFDGGEARAGLFRTARITAGTASTRPYIVR